MCKLFVFLLFLFYANFAHGFYIQDVINGCDTDALHPTSGITYFRANYTPHQHNCLPGYYLPANTDGCVVCPAGYTCVGGNFSFNQVDNQGIEYNTILTENVTNGCNRELLRRTTTSQLRAIFTPNEHTCSPGYYLPADTDGCVICPANSYCPGGTYTFNESAPQGITACSAGLYSPTGAHEVAQCGHILHVGNDIVYLRATKITSPALHVSFGNDIFYGNMTTSDIVMHSGSEHKMYIKYNNQTYSVYDDTVTVP